MTIEEIEKSLRRRNELILNPSVRHPKAVGAKHMDSYAGIPHDQIPEEERVVSGQVWEAYSRMMTDSNREYIIQAATEELTQHESFAMADLGSGNGHLSKYFVEALARTGDSADYDISLIDRSAVALQAARKTFRELGFVEVGNNGNSVMERKSAAYNHQTLHFSQQDITKLDTPSESFDTVTGLFFLHHLPSYSIIDAFNEIFRVLKPGGLFVLLDTAPLEGLWQTAVVGKVIDKVVSVPQAVKRAEENGITVTEDYRRGAERFVFDARQAFIQALNRPQLDYLLGKSELKGNFLRKDILSPDPLRRLVYPAVHMVTGHKAA